MNTLTTFGNHFSISNDIQNSLSRCIAAGICTAERLLASSDKVVCEASGLLLMQVVELKKQVAERLASAPISALDLLDDQQVGVFWLPTSCTSLDQLLGGGIRTGELTEVVGSSGSAKTQLCMTVAARLAQTADVSIVYIDTTNGFNATRIASMIEFSQPNELDQQQQTPEDCMECLNNISCIKVFDSIQLIRVLEQLISECVTAGDETKPLRLVVLDSITPIVSPVLGGKAGGSRNHHGHLVMATISRLLKELAVSFGAAAMVVNSTVRGGTGVKPALGLSWTYEAATQLFLTNVQGVHEATLTKSSRQATGQSVRFTVGPHGVEGE